MEGMKMTMKLSNMKLYTNSVKMLVIAIVLSVIITSVQSCDERDTSPAYAKTNN